MFHVDLPVDTQFISELSPSHWRQDQEREQGIQLPVLHT